MKYKPYLLTVALCMASSFATYFIAISTPEAHSQQAAADNEYQVSGVLYMQHAAEYRALCYQAFNAAKNFLDKDLEKKTLKALPKEQRKMPRAVVVDIDETVLDNSPAQAFGIINRLPFNMKDWYAWGEMRKAKAVPGSLEFLRYASSKGYKVFYISNRDEVQRQATMDNLKALGFPDVENGNVLLRQGDSGKKTRRDKVLENHRIVVLAGDNLNDISEAYEKRSVAERFAETDRLQANWGGKYIVLPNAMYGAWEDAIYDNKRLSEPEKAAKRKASLITF